MIVCLDLTKVLIIFFKTRVILITFALYNNRTRILCIKFIGTFLSEVKRLLVYNVDFFFFVIVL